MYVLQSWSLVEVWGDGKKRLQPPLLNPNLSLLFFSKLKRLTSPSLKFRALSGSPEEGRDNFLSSPSGSSKLRD
jgi:hypothetical protein